MIVVLYNLHVVGDLWQGHRRFSYSYLPHLPHRLIIKYLYFANLIDLIVCADHHRLQVL